MTKTNALPRPIGATVLSLLALALAALVLPASSLAAPGGGVPLVISPPALSFGKTTVGNQSQGKEVDLYNEAEEEVAIEKVAIEGEDAPAFYLNNNCYAVGWFGHCGLWLTFAPNSAGEKHASLVITFKDGRPAQSVELSGTAVEPQLTFSPSSYDFGLQRVYESRNTYLQLTNSGEADVQVNNLEISAGSGSFWTGNSDCWSHPLQPGESCNVEVDFSPQDAVAYTAQLRASANGYGFSADLSGEGGRAVIDATPNPVQFGPTTVGTTSEIQTIELTNSGNIPAGFFIGIVAGGDSASFQLLSENCTGAELMPSASCTARVRFRPQDAGPKAAYMAFFGDNDGGAMVALRGEGIAPAVTLAPAAFDFGSQAAATKSEAHAFAVRNDGTASLDLGTVAIVGADLDQFALAGDECTGETLAPGAECQVRVRFAPDSAGAKAAKLRVGSDSGAFVATLAGVGTGAAASPVASWDGSSGQPGPPPRPWRQARHLRFVRGKTLSLGKLGRHRRIRVRANTIPR